MTADTDAPQVPPTTPAQPQIGLPQAPVVPIETQTPKIISTSGTKPDNRKVKVGNSINLLSDTERIIKAQQIQGTVFKVSAIVVLFCMIIGGASYGAWWWQNDRLTRLQDNVETAKSDLNKLSDIYQYVMAYDDRLSQIDSVRSGNTKIVPKLINDLDLIADENGSLLATFEYEDKEYAASYQISSLNDLHNLLETLNDKEVEDQIWAPIVIDTVATRGLDYVLDYSTSLTKQYEATTE